MSLRAKTNLQNGEILLCFEKLNLKIETLVKTELYESTVRLIGHIIDAYIDRYLAEGNSELVSRFMVWIEDGVSQEEKDAAMLRKFNEIYDNDENSKQLCGESPQSGAIFTQGRYFDKSQRAFDDLWRRILERKQQKLSETKSGNSVTT